MRLGKSIISEEGRVLLGAKIELTESLIKKLAQAGFHYLFIDDPRTDDITVADPIREETRRVAYATISTALIRYSQDYGAMTMQAHSLTSRMMSELVDLILDDIYTYNQDTVSFLNINVLKPREWQKHYCHNALNVTVYACLIGKMEGMSRTQLKELGMGAMLHDIGNVRIPSHILHKPDRLTAAEFKQIQRHTEIGYDLLKYDDNVPPESALCALQHHEQVNGGGYPQGLPGRLIHPYSKWVGLIDAYDALCNTRCYRGSYLPHEAMEALFAGAGSKFDMKMVQTFRNRVDIYPPGTPVRLSTGQRGIIARVTRMPLRPVVRILENEYGEELPNPYEIDLSQHLNIVIDQVTGCETMLVSAH